MNLSSKLLENAVHSFASLPGIGKKSALRLALHLLNSNTEQVDEFCESISKMRKHIKFCKVCHNISDDDICNICASHKRTKATICVVEGIKDIMAIENTQHYNGMYHVLGGLISPIEGISPSHLNIQSLIDRVQKEKTEELIMALSPSIEGDTTIFYISKQLKDTNIKVTTISRGVSFGGELEYADELTLGRSIISRVPYKKS